MENYYEVANKLVPNIYLQQASDARRSREKFIRDFLEHKKWPQKAWDDSTIEQLVNEIANMDSNNFPGNCGVGEREARIFSGLVAKRHYRLGHGIGRSGDISEPQPKAAGSSLMNGLTNLMLKDLVKIMGVTQVESCLLMPVCTGMTLSLCMSSLRQVRPNGKYVIWSRIDQKSSFKSIVTAGFIPIIVDTVMVSHGWLNTDVDAIRRILSKHKLGQDILCVMTTTSCFAPRSCDDITEVARLCDEFDVPHIVNNAYGLQSHSCMHKIQMAAKEGRVDLFVQSCDKNLLVPVSGAIVAGFSKEVMGRVAQIYPGRASISPTLDVFITLLSLGSYNYLQLVKQRKELFVYMRHELSNLADKHGERVVENVNNTISSAITLSSLQPSRCTMVGSMLFMRGISGARVIENSDTSVKFICGYEFKNWGAHTSSPCKNILDPITGTKKAVPYLTAAAALGCYPHEIDVFLKKLDKILTKMRGSPIAINLDDPNNSLMKDLQQLKIVQDEDCGCKRKDRGDE